MIRRLAPRSIRRLGDRALVLYFKSEVSDAVGDSVLAYGAALRELVRAEVPHTEVIPAFASVTLLFAKPLPAKDRNRWVARIRDLDPSKVGQAQLAAPIVSIPVRYDGPDLQWVADHHQISVEELIRLHTTPEYRVWFIGFSPGFPYLGGLDPKLATPRLDSPRVHVPSGSVGIGGAQTGVYTVDGPGGWRIIGKVADLTQSIRFFDPRKTPPSLLQPGMKVRFVRE